MTAQRDGWMRVTLAAHAVLGVASALALTAMVQAGSPASVVGAALLAAMVLHLAAHVSGQHPARAYLMASAAMVTLAAAPMPGWSTGVVLPSAGCFLLVLWRVTSTAAPPWPRLALGGGILGVVLAEGLAVARLAEGRLDVLQLLETGVLLTVVVGTWAGARRARAGREQEEAAELARITAARRAERVEIRRDLHDIMGHSLALMIAQAEASRVGARDEATREAIGLVAETGREAMGSLRAMLRVLDVTPSGTGAVPDLGVLPSLVEASSTPLHAVTFEETGPRGILSKDAELALVRVSQEGITNALRHLVPPMAVAVRLSWSSTTATLTVRDDGGTGRRAGADTGSGLIALAERVTAAGGALDVDQDPGGWCLSATVPVRITATTEVRR